VFYNCAEKSRQRRSQGKSLVCTRPKNLRDKFCIEAVRDRLWNEVYKAMFENWDNLEQEDKTKACEEMKMIFLSFL